MKIQILHHLNDKQKKKVEALLTACRAYEPLTLTPPLDAESCFDSHLPCFYLLYENNELLSFLSLFLPDRYSGEVMGFTHPAARQRGFFKRLWNEALLKLDAYIEDMELLFVTDGNSPDALAALEAMEGEYQYSEYIMEKDMKNDPGADTQMQSIRPVQPSCEALKQCATLHETIFCDGQQASGSFIREMFDTPHTRTFLWYDREKPAGIFHLTEWDQGTYLAGFGILPALQGQGSGTALLKAIPGFLTPGHTLVSLQVSSLNEAACHLYEAGGFTRKLCRDYYY